MLAVAPLASGGQRTHWRAGLQWGLGHTAGVVLIGLLMAATVWAVGSRPPGGLRVAHEIPRRGELDVAGYIDFATAPWRERADAVVMRDRFMAEIMVPQLHRAALDRQTCLLIAAGIILGLRLAGLKWKLALPVFQTREHDGKPNR